MAAAVKGAQANPQRPSSSDEPFNFRQVFEGELGQIRERRGAAEDPSGDLNGLALSGGGIRSATYCLGVLQGFRRLGMLARFDYLSTVSGGGFIGGWWSAWFSRSQHIGMFPPPERIEPGREHSYRKKASSGLTDSSISAGVDPIHHVRLFSNYLTPRKGALSLDTWRAITVGFRNLLATWLILLPVMVALILLVQMYFVYFQGGQFFGAPAKIGDPEWSQRVRLLLAPLIFLGGLFATTSFAWVINTWDSGPLGTPYIRFISFVSGLAVGVLVAGVAVYETFEIDLWSIWEGGLKDVSTDLWPISKAGLIDLFTTQLPTALALIWLIVAMTILLWRYWPAITRKCTPEELGTRLTQASEVILVVLVAVGVALGFFAFVQEVWAFTTSQTRHYVIQKGGWLAVFSALASIAFTLWKALPTGGGDLRADGKSELPSQVVFAIAPPAALVIIGWLAAEAVDRSFADLLANGSVRGAQVFYGGAFAFVLLSLLCSFLETWRHPKMQDRLHWILGFVYLVFLIVLIYWWRDGLTKTPAQQPLEFLVFTGLALMLGWVGTFGWYVDPNELSLHSFYKARLTRAYLGASNPKRFFAGSEVTEAVNGDDVLLSDLRNCQSGAPYHLINTTLNLVGGHDLGTAQRMAEPFLLSKLYCGAVGGYRPTEYYMNGRLTLGTAVAVSGAAVSPNMGSMTVGSALAMLMTFFNIRLGYWAPTPSHTSWRSPQARHWPWYTLREFLSQTTDQAKYCNLSDGGHFDNTGVYSLVQRACRLIVMVDCGADPKPCFQDLGGVIRRCRIDFGAEIDIDITGLTDAASPVTRCLLGTITYSPEHLDLIGRPRQDCSGTLILIKPSLTAKEASGKRAGGNPPATADIRQFRITNPDYPNISTADQWFSEAQFESYRQLGELSAETTAALLVIRLLTILFSW